MTVRTVTLSPGFDHEVLVDRIEPGAVGAVLRWQTHPSGKGLNVSRTLSALGGQTVAYSLVGAAEQEMFTALAVRDGYPVNSVAIDQPTRNNLTLRVDATGESASHATGPRFSDVAESVIEDLFRMVVADTSPGDVVSFNGSLPGGLRHTAWADIAARLQNKGAILFSDVQGEAMVAVLATGLVHAAKPNHQESFALVDSGADRPPLETAVDAVRRMRSLGVADPIVTLGPLGAVHIVDQDVVRSVCPAAAPQVEVGAGDAFVAGYCAAVNVANWQGNSPVSVGLAAASAHVDGVDGGELVTHTESRLARIMTEVLERF